MCNDTYLLGGYLWWPFGSQFDKYFERKYDNLPQHSILRFAFTVWALDGWEYSAAQKVKDCLILSFDSQTPIPLFGLLITDYASADTNYCGSFRSDVRDIFIFGSVPHTENSLNFKIISNMSGNTSDESFGVRDINLLFSTSPIAAPICGQITTVKSYDFPLCPCLKGFYNSDASNTVCSECHHSCASCYGGTENDCYECKEGYYFDGMGCKSCHPSCLRCSGPNYNQCEFCNTGYISFENICISSSRCTLPFISDVCSNSCLSPCDVDKNDSWSESCIPSCPTGQISDLEGFCFGNFLC